MENENDKNIEQPRKRGRPRKNQIIEKIVKKEHKTNFIKQEKEIILHLPLLMRDLNNKNKDNNFTIDNDSDESNDSNDSDDDIIKQNDENNTILTLSDEEPDQENVNKNYYDLLKESQEKDKIIRQLKDEILGYNNVLTEYNNVVGEKENYVLNMKIPLINYINGKQITPTKTDVCCWWCTYSFESIPIFIPEFYHDNKYYVFGCFCSFNCAFSYNLNMNDYKIKDRHSLLINMVSIIYNKKIDENIEPAPQREVLEKYGGPITINEYRKNFKSCVKEYRLIIPPMSSIIPSIEILTKDKLVYKHDINKFSQEYEEKPDIFNSMGIKIKKKT
jgi:hypothetical protein